MFSDGCRQEVHYLFISLYIAAKEQYSMPIGAHVVRGSQSESIRTPLLNYFRLGRIYVGFFGFNHQEGLAVAKNYPVGFPSNFLSSYLDGYPIAECDLVIVVSQVLDQWVNKFCFYFNFVSEARGGRRQPFVPKIVGGLIFENEERLLQHLFFFDEGLFCLILFV